MKKTTFCFVFLLWGSNFHTITCIHTLVSKGHSRRGDGLSRQAGRFRAGSVCRLPKSPSSWARLVAGRNSGRRHRINGCQWEWIYNHNHFGIIYKVDVGDVRRRRKQKKNIFVQWSWKAMHFPQCIVLMYVCYVYYCVCLYSVIWVYNYQYVYVYYCILFILYCL